MHDTCTERSQWLYVGYLQLSEIGDLYMFEERNY